MISGVCWPPVAVTLITFGAALGANPRRYLLTRVATFFCRFSVAGDAKLENPRFEITNTLAQNCDSVRSERPAEGKSCKNTAVEETPAELKS